MEKEGLRAVFPFPLLGPIRGSMDAVQGGRGHRTLPKLPARPIMTRDRFFVHEI
jgi:hypothetical protein